MNKSCAHNLDTHYLDTQRRFIDFLFFICKMQFLSVLPLSLNLEHAENIKTYNYRLLLGSRQHPHLSLTTGQALCFDVYSSN